MSVQSSRRAARDFIAANLGLLAADVIAWRKMAVLPPNSKVHDLANLCVGVAADGDEYQEAERLIAQFALEQAAAPAQLGAKPSGIASEVGGKYPYSVEAFNRLLPKLAWLEETADDMTDDQFNEWVNALPKDEFLEFMAVNLDDPRLRRAVALARANQV